MCLAKRGAQVALQRVFALSAEAAAGLQVAHPEVGSALTAACVCTRARLEIFEMERDLLCVIQLFMIVLFGVAV